MPKIGIFDIYIYIYILVSVVVFFTMSIILGPPCGVRIPLCETLNSLKNYHIS